jgi:hypothetical protein
MLTEQEYADRAKVCAKTIRRLIQQGRLDAEDLGTGSRHNYRIAPDAVVRPPTKQAASAPASAVRRRRPVPAAGFVSVFA